MFKITDTNNKKPKKKKPVKRKKRRSFFGDHNFDKNLTDEEFFEIIEDD